MSRVTTLPPETQEELAELLGEQHLPSPEMVDPDQNTEEELLLTGMSSDDAQMPSQHALKL